MGIRVLVNAPGSGGAEGAGAVPVGLLERGVTSALTSGSEPDAEISVTLLDDEGIRALNRRYLEADRPTDVLAFALHGEGEPILGDVYLGVDQARRQAADLGVPLHEELVRLAVHGTLHVLGHEHPEGPEREESEMFRRQEEIVQRVLGARAPHEPGSP